MPTAGPPQPRWRAAPAPPQEAASLQAPHKSNSCRKVWAVVSGREPSRLPGQRRGGAGSGQPASAARGGSPSPARAAQLAPQRPGGHARRKEPSKGAGNAAADTQIYSGKGGLGVVSLPESCQALTKSLRLPRQGAWLGEGPGAVSRCWEQAACGHVGRRGGGGRHAQSEYLVQKGQSHPGFLPSIRSQPTQTPRQSAGTGSSSGAETKNERGYSREQTSPRQDAAPGPSGSGKCQRRAARVRGRAGR